MIMIYADLFMVISLGNTILSPVKLAWVFLIILKYNTKKKEKIMLYSNVQTVIEEKL